MRTPSELYLALGRYLVVKRAEGGEVRTFKRPDGRIMAVRWCPDPKAGDRPTLGQFCQAYGLERER